MTAKSLIGLFALVLGAAAPAPAFGTDPFREEREAMVDLVAHYRPEYRVTDKRVLAAMRRVRRHEFVPSGLRQEAYADRPLAIGEEQTISQPLIVGFMTELLELKPGDRVLEIGTGSGYQAAILAELAREVYTIEIVEALGRRAEATLKRLGYGRVKVRVGDGYRGWPEAAPFDAVIVTCAPDHVPQQLIDQLKVGGRLVIPVGAESKEGWSAQELILLRKTPKGIERAKRMDVRFVPMTGQAQRRR